jgi:hypothetical protein
LRMVPVAKVLLWRSDPAKSTKLKVEVVTAILHIRNPIN